MRITLAVGLAVLALLTVLIGLAGPAVAADQCAAPGGDGCFTTIQAAIDAATDGDTVRVVVGTYPENIVISKDLTLLGGFDDTTWNSRTPRGSIINGGGLNSVIRVTGGAVVTIEGFTVTGGDGTANNGDGGGIFVDTATVTIVDNLIENNVASSDPALDGDGGGIYTTRSTTVISGNTIQFNRAYSATTGSGMGAGGGIAIGTANDEVTIINNEIFTNTAAFLTSSTSAFGFGGGISCSGQKLVVAGNAIRDNVALTAGTYSAGGGINVNRTLAVTITNNLIVENTTTIAGTGSAYGGGLSAGGQDGVGRRIVLSGNQVMSNTAAVTLTGFNVSAAGGGVNIFGGGAADDTLLMQNNQIIGNVAAHSMTGTGDSDNSAGSSQGGGVVAAGMTSVQLLDNEVRNNTVVDSLSLTGTGGWGGSAAGGGIALSGNDAVTVNGNTIQDNIGAGQQTANGVDAGTDGGGMSLEDNKTATVSNNTISGNIGVVNGSLTGTDVGYWPGGGGVNAGCWGLPGCRLSFVGNTFSNNLTAQTLAQGGSAGVGANGGGLNIARAQAVLNQNRFFDNQSSLQDEFSDMGALWMWESVVTSTNNIFAGNIRGAGAGGDGTPSQVTFTNDSFYNNGETGIRAGSKKTVMSVTNTIVAGHERGFDLYVGENGSDGSFLYSDYNLLNNVDNYEDATPGTQDILNQDPKFVNAANNDFHLAAGSPAINKGTSVGAPSADFEGDARPQAGKIDIGADEYSQAGGEVYLPTVIK